MRDLMLQIENDLNATLRERLAAILAHAAKLPEDEGRRLERAATLRGLCSALMADGLKARDLKACVALLVGSKTPKRGRPELPAEVKEARKEKIFLPIQPSERGKLGDLNLGQYRALHGEPKEATQTPSPWPEWGLHLVKGTPESKKYRAWLNAQKGK